MITYSDTEKGTKEGEATEIPLSELDKLTGFVGENLKEKLLEEIELLDGASAEFDLEQVQAGELTPVFFGSALTNFGVEDFLQHFLQMTTTPLPRRADIGLIDPVAVSYTHLDVYKRQVMITGDHVATAFAVGKKLGIVSKQSQCMTGEVLSGLSELSLIHILEANEIKWYSI